MYWPRIVLGLAIVAMTVTMFAPLPLWLAVTLMILSLGAAVSVVIHWARTRPES